MERVYTTTTSDGVKIRQSRYAKSEYGFRVQTGHVSESGKFDGSEIYVGVLRDGLEIVGCYPIISEEEHAELCAECGPDGYFVIDIIRTRYNTWWKITGCNDRAEFLVRIKTEEAK